MKKKDGVTLTFPILYNYRNEKYNNSVIAWSVIEPHRKQAYYNHGQTLERLAERGGLGWSEAYFILKDSDFILGKFKDDVDARPYVLCLEQIRLGHSTKYTIRDTDSVSSILTSLYGCAPNSLNAKLLLFCLKELNYGCKSFNDVKIGMIMEFPTLLITNDEKGVYAFQYVNPLINVGKYSKGKTEILCSACRSNSDLYGISIGCNNSTLESRLCKKCLNTLYKKLGAMLNE